MTASDPRLAPRTPSHRGVTVASQRDEGKSTKEKCLNSHHETRDTGDLESEGRDSWGLFGTARGAVSIVAS